MIRNYNDHAANERTFLAWVRTSLNIIAFGIVVDRLNDWIPGKLSDSAASAANYIGISLVLLGVVLLFTATIRMRHIEKQIDEETLAAWKDTKNDTLFGAVLSIIGAAVLLLSIYLFLN